MGFSRGGGAAHWSAQKRFLAMHGPTGGLQFAGHIAFYPTCNRFFTGWLDVVDKPIRVFHGTADDYIPAAGCRSYVEQLQKAGRDATFTEYADAHHVFDWAALKNPLKLPQAQVTSRCPPFGRVIRWPNCKQPDQTALHVCKRPVRRTRSNGRLQSSGACRGTEGRQGIRESQSAAQVTTLPGRTR